MPVIAQSPMVYYRDLETVSDSGEHTSDILPHDAVPRHACSLRRASLAGVFLVVALAFVCLLPPPRGSSASPRTRPAFGALNLNEDVKEKGGGGLRGVKKEASQAEKTAEVKVPSAKADSAKAEEKAPSATVPSKEDPRAETVEQVDEAPAPEAAKPSEKPADRAKGASEAAEAYAKESAKIAKVYAEDTLAKSQAYVSESAEKAKALADESLKRASSVKRLDDDFAAEAGKRAKAYAEDSAADAGHYAKSTLEKAAALAAASLPKAEGPASPKEAGDAPGCVEDDAAYDPLDMPGTAVAHAEDIAACRERCAGMDDCAHFTFFRAAKSCHLANAHVSVATGILGAQAGTLGCEEHFKKL